MNILDKVLGRIHDWSTVLIFVLCGVLAAIGMGFGVMVFSSFFSEEVRNIILLISFLIGVVAIGAGLGYVLLEFLSWFSSWTIRDILKIGRRGK